MYFTHSLAEWISRVYAHWTQLALILVVSSFSPLGHLHSTLYKESLDQVQIAGPNLIQRKNKEAEITGTLNIINSK